LKITDFGIDPSFHAQVGEGYTLAKKKAMLLCFLFQTKSLPHEVLVVVM
jgi:hypothetical protein